MKLFFLKYDFFLCLYRRRPLFYWCNRIKKNFVHFEDFFLTPGVVHFWRQGFLIQGGIFSVFFNKFIRIKIKSQLQTFIRMFFF